MRDAVKAEMSFSGRRVQTILFNHRDAAWLAANLEAGRRLIARANAEAEAETVRPGVTVLRAVPSKHVLEFLGLYNVHENSTDLDPRLVGGYIERENTAGRLTDFTVAIFGREPVDAELGAIDLGAGHVVGLITAPASRESGSRMQTSRPS